MIGFQRAKLHKGFTLIEVVASLAIIGLGLIGILSLFPVGIDASKRASDLTNATVLAHGVLDQIRATAKNTDLTLNEIEQLFESSTPVDFREDLSKDVIPIVDYERVPQHRLYQYQVAFDDPKDDEQTDTGYKPYKNLSDTEVGLWKVTVTVSWPKNEPQMEFRHRVTLVTLIRFPE